MFPVGTYMPMQDTAKVNSKKPGFFKRLFQHNDSAKQARKFIHQHHKLLKEDSRVNFAMGMDSMNLKSSFFETADDFRLGYEVFGFYPYWEKNYYKHINFSLLSTVAYFSYEVDPSSGNAISTHDWESTDLIDSIRAYPNKRVLLTVSNFGIRNNRRFLRNPKAMDKLITNLQELLAKRGADGVCIDFEGVEKKDKDRYTSFMINLANKLKEYKIYMAIPSVDFSKSLDYGSLVKVVDRFVIMGYDYYGKTSKIAGPVAPLDSGKEWWPYDLEYSVDAYMKKGIPNTKLLLALPNYGSLWETQSLKLKSEVKKYVGARTYSYIKSKIETRATTFIEPVSKSAYAAYSIDGSKNGYRQCWFENDSTFSYKIDFIKDKKLAGLGIWALGYDKGYDDIWEVISEKMAMHPDSIPDASNEEAFPNDGSKEKGGSEEKTQPTDTVSKPLMQRISDMLHLNDPEGTINQVEEKLPDIGDYKYVLLYLLSFMLFFGCVGFVAAMFLPNTRSAFFGNTALRSYYMGFMMVILVVVTRLLDLINDITVVLIIGFVLGAFAFYIANKLIEYFKQNLP